MIRLRAKKKATSKIAFEAALRAFLLFRVPFINHSELVHFLIKDLVMSD